MKVEKIVLTKDESRRAAAVAFAIVCLAEFQNDLRWLTKNSFVMCEAYKGISLKLFPVLSVHLITAIDDIIGRTIK